MVAGVDEPRRAFSVAEVDPSRNHIMVGLLVVRLAERLASIAGETARDEIFEGIEAPPLGSPPEKFPEVTSLLVERLQRLGAEACHRVLAGNHHRIPVESFNKHKQWLRDAEDIDAFLKKVHDEAVGELEIKDVAGAIKLDIEKIYRSAEDIVIEAKVG